MKRCSDCHFQRIIDGPTMAAEGYTICTRKPRGDNGIGDCEGYARKRWLWWAWWIPKVLLLTLALLLGGCSQHIVTLPDGSTYKANRFLDWTKIGSVSYDDGSFTLDGYESDLTRALGTIDRLIAEREEEKLLAERR